MVKATYKQTFIGVWFHNNSLSSDQTKEMIRYLQGTFYYYKIFDDEKDFANYIDEEKLIAQIFLIISISTLSIFRYAELAHNRPEFFKKVYLFLPTKIHSSTYFSTTRIDDLFKTISTDIEGIVLPNNTHNETNTEPEPARINDINKIPPVLSVPKSNSASAKPIGHLTKEPYKFLSFLVLRDILIKESYYQCELEEMWMKCRNFHIGNETQIQYIDDLESSYKQEQAIKYYTQAWFLPGTVNYFCGTENIQEIYKFRVFINDLHKELSQYYEKQKDTIISRIKEVFRGKVMSSSVLQQLIDNVGGLIYMNGFLSTTTDENVASIYAGHQQTQPLGKRSTVFHLSIGNDVKQTCADISDVSKMQDESEVLFSLGTIWRIESVARGNDLWKIKLTPRADIDPELAELRQKYTGENVTLQSLGDLLYELGDYDEALWAYEKMLDRSSNDNRIQGFLKYKIGTIHFDKGNYNEAMSYYKTALSLLPSTEIEQNESVLPPRPLYICHSHAPFVTIYNNMAVIFEKKDKYEEACSYYLKALEVDGGLPSELAVVHNNLGRLYFLRGEYTEAEKQQIKACELGRSNPQLLREFQTNLNHTEDQLKHNEKRLRC